MQSVGLNGGWIPRDAYFCIEFIIMNTQEIITPVAKFIEWTFETFLVPISDPFNSAVVCLGFIGLAFWLWLQKKYTAKAKKEGGMI